MPSAGKLAKRPIMEVSSLGSNPCSNMLGSGHRPAHPPNMHPTSHRMNRFSLCATSAVSQSNICKDDNSFVAPEVPLNVVSFNVLAPCYKRIPLSVEEQALGGHSRPYCMEAEREDAFMKRNKDICTQLRQTNADIICLQEFWSGSEALRELYLSNLCTSETAGGSCYSLHVLPRTSHWRSRADSIAVLVKNDKLIVEDVREILFHDCGDRVALMLLLAIRPEAVAAAIGNNSISSGVEGAQQLPHYPAQRFLCVNTHLLFPHNEYSTKIRLREITKILGYVEAYKQKELCTTICGRADVRLPILIAGDFNGSPRGAVYNFARSQNYKSATEEFWRRGAGSLHSLDAAAVPAALPVSTQQNGIEQQVLKATVAAGPVVSGAAAGTAVGTGVHDFSSEFFDGISADKALAQQSQSEAAPSTSSTISTALTTSTTTQSIDATATNGAAGNTPQRNPQDEEVEAHVGVTTPSVGTWDRWISHRSHRGQNVPVDHIFFLNPSDQVEERLPPLPDWTNLVFQELVQRLAETGFPAPPSSSSSSTSTSSTPTALSSQDSFLQQGAHSPQSIAAATQTATAAVAAAGSAAPLLGVGIRDIFAHFDQDSSNYVSREEFASALRRLGFVGEGTPCLTDEEIDMLVRTADKNNDGTIDYKEFYDRFWLASAVGEYAQKGDESTPSTNNPTSAPATTATAEAAMQPPSDSSNPRSSDDSDDSDDSSDAFVGRSAPASSGTLLLNRRLAFARSEWLSEDVESPAKAAPSADQDKDDDKFASTAGGAQANAVGNGSGSGVGSAVIRQRAVRSYGTVARITTASRSDDSTTPSATSIVSPSSGGGASADANEAVVVELGDLRVGRVGLFPADLEHGDWPADFTLSDHGILQCQFFAAVNTATTAASTAAAATSNVP